MGQIAARAACLAVVVFIAAVCCLSDAAGVKHSLTGMHFRTLKGLGVPVAGCDDDVGGQGMLLLQRAHQNYQARHLRKLLERRARSMSSLMDIIEAGHGAVGRRADTLVASHRSCRGEGEGSCNAKPGLAPILSCGKAGCQESEAVSQEAWDAVAFAVAGAALRGAFSSHPVPDDLWAALRQGAHTPTAAAATGMAAEALTWALESGSGGEAEAVGAMRSMAEGKAGGALAAAGAIPALVSFLEKSKPASGDVEEEEALPGVQAATKCIVLLALDPRCESVVADSSLRLMALLQMEVAATAQAAAAAVLRLQDFASPAAGPAGHALQAMAEARGTRGAIVQSGALPAVVKLLEAAAAAPPGDVADYIDVAFVACQLAADASTSLAFAEAGAARALRLLLSSRTEALRLHSAYALWSLCGVGGAAVAALVREGGAMALVAALGDSGGAVRVAAGGAMWALVQGVDDVARQEILEGGAAGPLVSLLDDDTVEMEGRLHAAGALSSLVEGSPPAQKTVVDAGAIAPLVRALGDGEAPEVQVAAARVLWILAGGEVETVRRMKKEGAVGPLMRHLTRGSAEVKTYASGAISLISAAVPGEGPDGLSRGWALPGLIDMLHQPPGLVRNAAANHIGMLVHRQPLVAEFIVAAGVVPTLVGMLPGGEEQVRCGQTP
mmetsp:Transcript_23911/g.74750  ORF Transcript_23911/g.74750 Transcript_23911/m.74750 type:complete len:669 (-) Transcript_23911:22-2028(-)